MDPLLHYLSLRMQASLVDSPETARRRDTLRAGERDTRLRRTQRRERVRQAVALTAVLRWRGSVQS